MVNESSSYQNRVIPKADISGFIPPDMIRQKQSSAEDFSLIMQIKEELISSGVISSDTVMSEVEDQTIDDLVSMFAEANVGAVSEKEYNPDFFSQSATDALEEQERVLEYDWENPDINGFDNYEEDLYPNVRNRTAEDYLPRSLNDSILPEDLSLDGGHVRLPDGTEITGEGFNF